MRLMVRVCATMKKMHEARTRVYVGRPGTTIFKFLLVFCLLKIEQNEKRKMKREKKKRKQISSS